MSKELCEKLIKETELIYEIIKNNTFNDEDVINEDNKNNVKKWLWNSIIFFESEKETKTELYKQILKLEKNKQLTYSEVKDIYRKINDNIKNKQKKYINLSKAIPIIVIKKDKSHFEV